MNTKFQSYVDQSASLFAELSESPLRSLKTSKADEGAAGIYVFYENGEPVYVGRTRNLQSRLRAHVARSHNSASFALKRTRARFSLEATYKSEMSRKEIETQEPYRSGFLEEIAKIKEMQMRFLSVPDPIAQYLLELYATMALELDLTGFDTH